MFQSTLPLDAPELLQVSDFVHYLAECDRGRHGGGCSRRLFTLSTSLRLDLLRFEQRGREASLLEVIAGAVRHASDVCLHLAWGSSVVPLSLFPSARLAHAPVPMEELLAHGLRDARLLQAEPALLKPPGGKPATLVDRADRYHPLASLTFALALRGSSATLLPEIDGPAAYRFAPDLNIDALPIDKTLRAAATLLRTRVCSLATLSELPGMTRERAVRLLNAIYLQAGLVVSRTHPLAIQEMPLLRPLH